MGLIKLIKHICELDLEVLPLFCENQIVWANNSYNHDILKPVRIFLNLHCHLLIADIGGLFIFKLNKFCPYFTKLFSEKAFYALSWTAALVATIVDLSNKFVAFYLERSAICFLFVSNKNWKITQPLLFFFFLLLNTINSAWSPYWLLALVHFE